jgi:Ran GTPase-activating protein (RanGAP) involved in mRNA processing and transport
MQWEKADPGGVHLASCLTNMALRFLDLSNNQLTDSSLKHLGAELCTSRHLRVLHLNGNCVTAVGFAAVLPLGRHILDNNGKGVEEWGLRHNSLGDACCELLASSLPVFAEYNMGVKPLCVANWDLRTNGITSKGCKSLAPLLAHMSWARLGCNPLGDYGVPHIAKELGSDIKILDLRHAKIGDEGAAAIAHSLMNASALRELLLSGNEIGAHGAARLADGWSWVQHLNLVDLSFNPIGGLGVEIIAEELPYWQQSPFRLCLTGVGCSNEGVSKLKRALMKNPRRDKKWTIELGSNDMSPSHAIEIRGLLEENQDDTADTPGEYLCPLSAS